MTNFRYNHYSIQKDKPEDKYSITNHYCCKAVGKLTTVKGFNSIQEAMMFIDQFLNVINSKQDEKCF